MRTITSCSHVTKLAFVMKSKNDSELRTCKRVIQVREKVLPGLRGSHERGSLKSYSESIKTIDICSLLHILVFQEDITHMLIPFYNSSNTCTLVFRLPAVHHRANTDHIYSLCDGVYTTKFAYSVNQYNHNNKKKIVLPFFPSRYRFYGVWVFKKYN